MEYKKALFKITVLLMTVKTQGHRDRNALNDLDSTDEYNRENDIQRRGARQEWQYEGMPIEYPRRFEELPRFRTSATRTTTQETIDPPLDHRYRRIYNPDEAASIEDHPFLAALLLNGKLWCGGAIIASDLVITAAHCLNLQYNNRFFREYVRMLTMRVGSPNATSGGELYRVDEIFFHPNYKPANLEFNFAVVRLHKNLSFDRTDNIAKINYSNKEHVATDSQITFLGWGSVLGVGGLGGQVLLQKLTLPVYDFADCQEVYGRELVTRSNFCAGYISVAKNVCNHDAGGPAVLDGLLVGVLSFSAKRCDQPDKPAVFSKVGLASEWINHIRERANIFNSPLKLAK